YTTYIYYILSLHDALPILLSILGYMFTSGTQILYNVFPTVNKVKQNSIAMIITGILSVSLTVLLIKTTNLGIYAVAGKYILQFRSEEHTSELQSRVDLVCR